MSSSADWSRGGYQAVSSSSIADAPPPSLNRRSSFPHLRNDSIGETDKFHPPSESSLNYEVLTSFYEYHDVRVPSIRFRSLLQRFYFILLLCGVRVHSLESRPPQLLVSKRAREDMLAMSDIGTSPYPLIEHGDPANSFWIKWTKWQYLYAIPWWIALALHTVINLNAALHSDSKFLRSFFAIFLLFAVIASVQLASDLLTRRLLGTRIFYTARVTSMPVEKTEKLIRQAVLLPFLFGSILILLGWAADWSQRHEISSALQQLFDPSLVHTRLQVRWSATSHSNLHVPVSVEPPASVAVLMICWHFASALVYTQLVTGVCAFAALLSIHLLRCESCLRALRRPGTSVHGASLQLFDLDVSLAELAHVLDMRLSLLLVSSFLTFWFQAVFLANRSKADEAEAAMEGTPDALESNALDASAAKDLLTLAVPGALCAWILLALAAVNHACQRIKLVATRFCVFHQREALTRKYARKQMNDNDQSTIPTASTSTPITSALQSADTPSIDPILPDGTPHDAYADPKLLEERLNQLANYLDKGADISLRLADIQIDQKVTWYIYIRIYTRLR
jgi:hypothetical protein